MRERSVMPDGVSVLMTGTLLGWIVRMNAQEGYLVPCQTECYLNTTALQ